MVQFVEYMTECVNMDEQKKMMELRDILTEIEEKRENGIVNITVRQSRQSGVARATCPD